MKLATFRSVFQSIFIVTGISIFIRYFLFQLYQSTQRRVETTNPFDAAFLGFGIAYVGAFSYMAFAKILPSRVRFCIAIMTTLGLLSAVIIGWVWFAHDFAFSAYSGNHIVHDLEFYLWHLVPMLVVFGLTVGALWAVWRTLKDVD